MAQGSVRIWWDEQVSAYRMTSPYSGELVDFLKQAIPHQDRSWDKASKIWTFTEKWLAPVESLCSKLFGAKPTVISKADAQKAQIPPSTPATLPGLHQQFFELLPYEAMRKAYLAGIQILHPDRGGDVDKAARLNAIWQRLEKEFYNK